MIRERLRDSVRLIHHSARTVAGRRFWLAPLLPPIWIAIQYFRVWIGWRETSYDIVDAQNVLIGFPLAVLAIGLGVRIIAGEIDRRTLEIAYTVPGGAHRIWLAKLTAATLILVVTELLLGLATYQFCTEYPISALYGALQGAIFFMVLAMGIAALFKSESAGAMVTIGLFLFAWLLQGQRVSPFFNAELLPDLDVATRVARLVQNRIGYLLATAGLLLLSFGRAEQRERMLGG